MKITKPDLSKLKPKNIHFKKFKVKKKFIALGAITLIIIIFVVTKLLIPKKTIISNYTTLQKSQIVNSVDASGTVKSEKTVNVYSKVQGNVKTINVKVGDKIKKGDVLAIIDSEKLERDIKVDSETINQDDKTLKVQIESKKRAYDNALYEEQNNMNSEVNSAKSDLKAKEVALEETQNNYEYNKELFNYGEVSEQILKKAQTDFEAAKLAYDNANIALENAKIAAKQKLQTAKEDYEAAQLKANDKTKKMALEDKKQDLENCEIKAPVSGTITSVKATEGEAANGTLFTIEDLNDVYIEVPIKEVDILNIKNGQNVEIKTDAMEDNLFVKGEVVNVSDTATQEVSSNLPSSSSNSNSNSASVSSSFQAKIKLKEENDKIKVGMNARTKIILRKAEKIYTVPFDCIIDGKKGKSIYVAEAVGDKYIVKELPVKVGIESDVNVQVSGNGIHDGVIVINDPTEYVVGTEVTISHVMNTGGQAHEG